MVVEYVRSWSWSVRSVPRGVGFWVFSRAAYSALKSPLVSNLVPQAAVRDWVSMLKDGGLNRMGYVNIYDGVLGVPYL